MNIIRNLAMLVNLVLAVFLIYLIGSYGLSNDPENSFFIFFIFSSLILNTICLLKTDKTVETKKGSNNLIVLWYKKTKLEQEVKINDLENQKTKG